MITQQSFPYEVIILYDGTFRILSSSMDRGKGGIGNGSKSHDVSMQVLYCEQTSRNKIRVMVCMIASK